jgi:hypothetical protein
MIQTALFATILSAFPLLAQVQPPPAPWRGAGPTPCVGSDGGVLQCPPPARVIAIRAGRMFNSKTGQMLAKQVVVLAGERISEVGPESQVKIPAGSQVIDLSQATVLPGLIDAHTHMFNARGPKGTTETSMLIAVQNAQDDLRAGFTTARDMSSHGNGYGDIAIRDAINQGRIDGPRYQVSTESFGERLRRILRRRRTRWQAQSSVRLKTGAPPSAIRLHTARTGSSYSQPAPTRLITADTRSM